METTEKILTEKEKEVIMAILTSDFYENGEQSTVWDYSVYDSLSFTGKIRSGVTSSLSQKGLVIITQKEKGDIAGTISITKEGYEMIKKDEELLKYL